MPTSTRARCGFTLVELLVVIGIIALLVSILLPSLSKAMRSARDVKCLSNLRQIATAANFYVIENGGTLPHTGLQGRSPSSPGGRYPESESSWPEKLDVVYRGRQSGGGSATVQLEDRPMTCPLAAVALPLVRNDNSVTTYALNYYLGAERSGAVPKPPKSVDLSAETTWFADAPIRLVSSQFRFNDTFQTTSNDRQEKWPWMFSPVFFSREDPAHGDGTSNFAFGDGHVERVAYKEFVDQRKVDSFSGRP